MEDFEKEFAKRVQEEAITAAKPEKKGWWGIVVGGIILILVAVIVVVVIVVNGAVEEDEWESSIVDYEGSIIGNWECDDGSKINFGADGGFAWINEGNEDNRLGTYTWDTKSLKLTVLSYLEDGQIVEAEESETEGWAEEFWVYEEEGKIIFESDEDNALLICDEVK